MLHKTITLEALNRFHEQEVLRLTRELQEERKRTWELEQKMKRLKDRILVILSRHP